MVPLMRSSNVTTSGTDSTDYIDTSITMYESVSTDPALDLIFKDPHKRKNRGRRGQKERY